jgi:hypothetical protein
MPLPVKAYRKYIKWIYFKKSFLSFCPGLRRTQKNSKPTNHTSQMDNMNYVSTTCGRRFDLRHTQKVITKSNSLFSYNIHRLESGEYIIEEKFYASPYNNRYILLNDKQIEELKLS